MVLARARGLLAPASALAIYEETDDCLVVDASFSTMQNVYARGEATAAMLLPLELTAWQHILLFSGPLEFFGTRIVGECWTQHILGHLPHKEGTRGGSSAQGRHACWRPSAAWYSGGVRGAEPGMGIHLSNTRRGRCSASAPRMPPSSLTAVAIAVCYTVWLMFWLCSSYTTFHLSPAALTLTLTCAAQEPGHISQSSLLQPSSDPPANHALAPSPPASTLRRL